MCTFEWKNFILFSLFILTHYLSNKKINSHFKKEQQRVIVKSQKEEKMGYFFKNPNESRKRKKWKVNRVVDLTLNHTEIMLNINVQIAQL